MELVLMLRGMRLRNAIRNRGLLLAIVFIKLLSFFLDFFSEPESLTGDICCNIGSKSGADNRALWFTCWKSCRFTTALFSLFSNISLNSAKFDFTVIDKCVVFRNNSSALLCEMFVIFWPFTSRIWNNILHYRKKCTTVLKCF